MGPQRPPWAARTRPSVRKAELRDRSRTAARTGRGAGAGAARRSGTRAGDAGDAPGLEAWTAAARTPRASQRPDGGRGAAQESGAHARGACVSVTRSAPRALGKRPPPTPSSATRRAPAPPSGRSERYTRTQPNQSSPRHCDWLQRQRKRDFLSAPPPLGPLHQLEVALSQGRGSVLGVEWLRRRSLRTLLFVKNTPTLARLVEKAQAAPFPGNLWRPRRPRMRSLAVRDAFPEVRWPGA